MVVGLRGIPGVQGGIETHAAELYPRLASLGADVTVIGRSRFRPEGVGPAWRGVRLHWIWSPKRRGFEAAIHTILGVLHAGIRRPDVLHIHAVGPSIAVPLAKLLRLRVVVTHHGQDYLREKWGGAERTLIRLGEKFAVRFSDEIIAVSAHLRSMLHAEYGRDATWIPNGVGVIKGGAMPNLLGKYRLTRGKYVIQVARLVPEKRQHDLIAAFRALKLPHWKLVLVGGSQGEDDYAASIQQAAAGDDAIVCTGTLEVAETHELLADAGVFVLPSSHEGLPIALLEALSCGVPALASDIPGNRELGLDDDSYFAVGDTAALSSRLKTLVTSAKARAAAARCYPEICRRFDWDNIAVSTIAVLQKASGSPRTRVRPRRAAVATVDVEAAPQK
jgi:glycosyltransferase involved in cell wall biosynthesis